MTYTVEIMLRNDETVYSETLHHIGNELAGWTAEDAATLMHSVLKAIDRVMNPDRRIESATTMRGVNWIVNTIDAGVVVAMEIHSASAVAGPFALDRDHLDSLLTEAVRTPLSSPGTVH